MGRKRKRILGNCKICGSYGRLSYEHVPPAKAYNNQRFYYTTSIEKLVRDEEILLSPASDRRNVNGERVFRKHQGGIGFYSLCIKCNNDTGRWYAKYFIEWVCQSMDILLKSRGHPTLLYPTFFYPLRIVKQIITMFFSIQPDEFRVLEPELVDFVLNKEKRFLSSRYKVFCYYNLREANRYLGNIFMGELGKSHVINMSEISFPPYGFVLTINSNETIDDRLQEITDYSRFTYETWSDFYQKFTSLPTYLPHIPGDYRSKEEIEKVLKEFKAKQGNK